ncbi:PREDICTED: disease resistance protein RPS6-like [Brassica oleracea var. oleracea]|uniref:disease resistance protein RPS6-like n=1 Tax=Brassica oleracea var. oleracea TaxID=109376 RepID=UPI0006A6F12B|nr:PREDICTED: disease resistance protein RPS6-like [Brassica oleracea var. oleracea]
MASSSSSSSAVIIHCAHDVFLSFRGYDVRRKFRSHFLKELDRKLITFKDDEMERGRSIAPELIKAIQGSRISVVAFSENFANSSWCLDELVEIMRCRENRGQMVIPIFYEVDPSHVRKQTHTFGEIFEWTCNGKTEEQKHMWRQALTNAANIVGEDSRNWHDEAKLVEKIVNDVSSKLNSTESNDFDDMVGIKSHMKSMNSMLNLESEEVIMVGVWGLCGVGKTTIGRALFSQLSCQFQGSIFIDKTKKNFTRAKSDDYNTHLFLQTQFLAEVLDQKDIKIHGLGAVEERLGHKRVLVVFDDMDDQVLLNALVGKTTWFGPRSRIVVISEDRQFLRARGIGSDRIYEVALPSEELALQMFCRCAFHQDSPPDGFMELATEAVNLTGNLPMCLNVLGSSLEGVKKEEWADRMPQLRICMAKQIDKTLRDSYDRLKEEDKAIFRHIACLFNHKPRDYVIRLLEDSKLDVDVGLVTLAERCLIQISGDNIITMHEFLQEMGREIVRQPCIQEPGEREFLMECQEICDVLVDGTGTKSVLGIFLNLSEMKDTLCIGEEVFRGMTNLRFLRIYGFAREDTEIGLIFRHLNLSSFKWWGGSPKRKPLTEGKHHMGRQLRLLEWWWYPMIRMPSYICAENLVELKMPDSQLEFLWGGVQLLNNLKKIDLRRSKKLAKLPNLSTGTNLEELCLEDCWSLWTITSSIRYLQKLRKLDMKRCKKLWDFPTDIDLESLHSLNLSGCSKLESFPHISRNISNLVLDETKIEEVPERIEDISGLNYILMTGFSNLKHFSSNISKLKHLEMMLFAVATTTDNSGIVHNRANDVFLSFHREDVHKAFVSYLQKEFMRDQDLSTNVVNEIRSSRIAIVILTDNYMGSKRCLDELVEIIKCSEEIGQKVIPVYYGVDTVILSKQIQDIVKTESYPKKLRQAFTAVTQLQGYNFSTWDPENAVSQMLADDISFAPKELSDVEALKLQFNGLMLMEKLLFCHIACFFNNETYENVTQLLKDSLFDVGGSLEILCKKSLIQISVARVIIMRPVLQKIGRDEVLAEFINVTANRQFLMDTEGCDLLINLTDNTKRIYGISFNVSEMEQRLARDERLKGMKRLRFVRMYKDSLYGKEVRVHLVIGLHSLWYRLSNI